VRITETSCDACREPILEGGRVVRVNAGELLARHSGPRDLCEACGRGLESWLRSRDPDVVNHGGPGQPRPVATDNPPILITAAH
jgi:hypothetical protein